MDKLVEEFGEAAVVSLCSNFLTFAVTRPKKEERELLLTKLKQDQHFEQLRLGESPRPSPVPSKKVHWEDMKVQVTLEPSQIPEYPTGEPSTTHLTPEPLTPEPLTPEPLGYNHPRWPSPRPKRFLQALGHRLPRGLTHADAINLLSAKLYVAPIVFLLLSPSHVAEMLWGIQWRKYIPMNIRDIE